MKKLYQNEWNLFILNYRLYFLILLFSFLLISSVSYFSFLSMPHITKSIISLIQLKFDSVGLTEETNPFLILKGIFLNNAKAAFITFVFGFVPIVIFPFLLLAINAGVIGAVLASVQLSGESVFQSLLYGILPHGLTELFSIFYAGAIGTYSSVFLLKKSFGKNKENASLFLQQVFRSFVLVVIPFLFVSAILESFITPIVMEMFMK
jgi:stage II sporulation protein M